MSKNALVIGVTGITGNNIAQELQQKGFTVYGLSRKPGIIVPGVKHVYGDVLDPASVKAAVADLPVTHLFFCTWSRQNTLRLMAQCCRTLSMPSHRSAPSSTLF